MENEARLRAAGLGCLVVASLFTWWGILRPLAAARAQEAQVHLYLNVALGTPALAVFGLFFLISGARWRFYDPASRKLTVTGWLLCAVAAIACVATYFYFDHQFELLGYIREEGSN
jgi:hypothetical protein